MGINESSVRSIENTKSAKVDNQLFRAAEELRKASEEKGFIDISFFDVDIPQEIVEYYNTNVQQATDANGQNDRGNQQRLSGIQWIVGQRETLEHPQNRYFFLVSKAFQNRDRFWKTDVGRFLSTGQGDIEKGIDLLQEVDFALVDDTVALHQVGKHFRQSRFVLFLEFHLVTLLEFGL